MVRRFPFGTNLRHDIVEGLVVTPNVPRFDVCFWGNSGHRDLTAPCPLVTQVRRAVLAIAAAQDDC
jgi:hypothetical protein